MLNWYYFKDLVVESIDKGTTSIEEIQKSVVKFPFEMLEKVDISSRVTDVKERQEETTSKIYDMIRTVNQQFGEIVGSFLKKEDANSVLW